MRKNLPYLALLLFCWINLPKNATDNVRSFAASSLSPLGKWGKKISRSSKGDSTSQERLQQENQILRAHIDSLHEKLLQDRKISAQLELLRTDKKKPPDEALFKRRIEWLKRRLENQIVSFPAQVIYRDPGSWSSSLWISAGEEDNAALGQQVVAKNSPVLAGNALVGVIDYVGKKQSRVRLITDSGLSPSVRAVRGDLQNREISQLAQMIADRIESRDDLFSSREEKERLISLLAGMKSKMGSPWDDGYLAKGELHGSSAPFWRSRGQFLKGLGFNYETSDEEGPARDLRTGKPAGVSGAAVPILKEGDLLVTSGLDGVFPPGLPVGTVFRVGPLKEGGYAYELEAKPSVSNFNDLQFLTVLPSLSSE